MTLYPIFTRAIAFRLERKGFKIIKIQPNKKNPTISVYYFEDTIELHEALLEVVQRRNRQYE